MNHSDTSRQLMFWKQLHLVSIGALIALSMSAINEFPAFPSQMFFTLFTWWFNPLYGGWLCAWLLLESTTGVAGLVILLAPRYRRAAAPQSLNLAFGYFAVTWLGILPFIARFRQETPPLLLWVTTVLVIILVALYAVLRRRLDMREELFP